MEHVTLKHINGTGLHLDEVWDVDIMTTQIQACGLGYTSSNNVVGLLGLEQAPMMDVMPLDLPDSTLRDVLNYLKYWNALATYPLLRQSLKLHLLAYRA
jgi:hypothetical protein